MALSSTIQSFHMHKDVLQDNKEKGNTFDRYKNFSLRESVLTTSNNELNGSSEEEETTPRKPKKRNHRIRPQQQPEIKRRPSRRTTRNPKRIKRLVRNRQHQYPVRDHPEQNQSRTEAFIRVL